MIQKQKRKRNPIRTVTTLSVILSIMPIDAARAQSPSLSPSPSPSWYDGFNTRLGYWSGEVGLNYMNGQTSLSSPNGSASTSTTNAFRESVRITNSGFYILSPRLFTGYASLVLQLNQNKNSGSGDSTAVQGEAIGYDIGGTFLEEKPYTASVFANRSQNQTLQPFGGSVAGIHESRGARFSLRQDSILKDWGYPWVEANLGIREEKNQNITTSFGHSLSTDEQSRTLDFTASKGFETADLWLNYRFNDQGNAAFSQSNFQSNAAALTYNLDFGPTLNRRLDSTLYYTARNSVSPSTAISNSERVHIDHYQNLSTDYQYGFDYQTSGGFSTLGQNSGFTVSHQFYNLSTSAGVNGGQTTMPNGSITTYGGQLGQGYNHSLPGKGNFSANWSGSYQLLSNNLSSSSISVIDEAHTAPTPFAAGVGFPLSHNFAVAASIEVFNVRGGGRVPLTTGVDYTVINENNQITIVPLAGSLLISPGDPLVVSYNYQVDANLKSATTSSGFGAGVNYRWISISFRHNQTTQTPLSQTSSLFLQNSREDSVQIGLQGTLLGMAANANMSLENSKTTGNSKSTGSNKSADIAYDRGRLGGSLAWVIQSNMRMVFGLNASETKYTLPVQRTNSSISARGSFDWVPADGWNNSASVNWSSYKGSTIPTETLVQAIAQSSIRRGKLSLTANVALGEWQRLGSRSTNRSFNISVVRQFR